MRRAAGVAELVLGTGEQVAQLLVLLAERLGLGGELAVHAAAAAQLVELLLPLGQAQPQVDDRLLGGLVLLLPRVGLALRDAAGAEGDEGEEAGDGDEGRGAMHGGSPGEERERAPA